MRLIWASFGEGDGGGALKRPKNDKTEVEKIEASVLKDRFVISVTVK